MLRTGRVCVLVEVAPRTWHTRHTSQTELTETHTVEIGVWRKAVWAAVRRTLMVMTGASSGDVTTQCDQKFVDSSQFFWCAYVKRNGTWVEGRGSVVISTCGMLVVCDVVEALSHVCGEILNWKSERRMVPYTHEDRTTGSLASFSCRWRNRQRCNHVTALSL
jgi:hypothetical protein